MSCYSVVCDLGSSSGRVLLFEKTDAGTFVGEECHRFPNVPHGSDCSCGVPGMHWHVDALLDEVLFGLQQVRRRIGDSPATISVCSWGVDYVVVDGDGHRIGPCWSYRDQLPAAALEQLQQRIPVAEHCQLTGVQPADFTTAAQLFARSYLGQHRAGDDIRVVLLGDYVLYWLSGVLATSPSLASTTALAAHKAREWSRQVVERLGLNLAQLPPIAPESTVIGHSIIPGCENFTVVRAATHDTAAAVAGLTTVLDSHSCFLSCGSWALVGAVVEEPLNSSQAFDLGWTNEVCADGRVRLLKNLNGLWVLQKILREMQERGLEVDLPRLVAEAERLARVQPAGGLTVDITDDRYGHDGYYLQHLSDDTGISLSELVAQPAVAVLIVVNSVARTIAAACAELAQLLGHEFDSIHMVGGGTKNKFLCEQIAQRTGLEVHTYAAEGTSAGSVIVQRGSYLDESNSLLSFGAAARYLP